MDLTLVVLAAGMGKRYGGLKQLDAVGPSGETIMDYSLFDALRAGFNKAVFVIRRDIEDAFRKNVSSRFDDKIAIEYAFQELDALPPGFETPPTREKPWGTGHAILVAEDVVTTPFAVINADDFYGAGSYRLLADFLNEAGASGVPEYAMVGYVLRKTLSPWGSVARGVCHCTENHYLDEVVEHTRIQLVGEEITFTDEAQQQHSLSGNETASMNLWAFTPSIFDHLRTQFTAFLEQHVNDDTGEFFIPTVVNDLVDSDQARVKVLSNADSWFGMTYPEDRPIVQAHVRELIQQGVYPQRLWC